MKHLFNRRWTPIIVHSDNAGKFILGKNIIKNVFDDLNTYNTHQKQHDELSITWYHAPSKAPSPSGVIERMVGTINTPLIKTLQGAILTETEFYTIIKHIEACITSWPLAKLSDYADDESLSCITPCHLIIGKLSDPYLPRYIGKSSYHDRIYILLKDGN